MKATSKSMLKLALAMAPAVAGLASALPAQAEVVLLGEDPSGWRFTTDGSVNGFLVAAEPDKMPAGGPRAGGSIGGAAGSSEDASNIRVRNGLLPTVFGFNVKSPDINGTKLASRIGIYPNIQNANTKNSFGGQLDLREAFFTADGAWGQLLVGKALSQFQSANLLNDMTLFGVGATGGVNGGGTTLGRIGHGYVYSQFNANLRYTTPSLGGVKASIGVYDPSQIQSTAASVNGASATVTKLPRIESEVSWAGKAGDVDLTVFGSGMWQDAEFANGRTSINGTNLSGHEVTAWGGAGGVKAKFGGFTAVASGFTGQALGTSLMLDSDSLDRDGKERKSNGYYVQGMYNFGQGTNVGLSWGGNYMDETSAEKTARANGTAVEIESQELLSAQVYHDINKYFRVVAEYDNVQNKWFDGQTRGENVFSVGSFFFW